MLRDQWHQVHVWHWKIQWLDLRARTPADPVRVPPSAMVWPWVEQALGYSDGTPWERLAVWSAQEAWGGPTPEGQRVPRHWPTWRGHGQAAWRPGPHESAQLAHLPQLAPGLAATTATLLGWFQALDRWVEDFADTVCVISAGCHARDRDSYWFQALAGMAYLGAGRPVELAMTRWGHEALVPAPWLPRVVFTPEDPANHAGPGIVQGLPLLADRIAKPLLSEANVVGIEAIFRAWRAHLLGVALPPGSEEGRTRF